MQIARTRTKYYVLSILGALAVAVGVLALAPSAQAQTNPTIIFVPGQPGVVSQGITLACSGGPPFTVEIPSGGPPGNCDVTSLGGSPSGLVCETPTTVTATTGLVPVFVLQGFICSAPVAPPADAPPAEASGSGGGEGGAAAPITQEGEQESEAGEIDQSFEVS